MGVREILGNSEDGNLGSAQDSLTDSDFKHQCRTGANVFIAGDDPAIGELLLIGAYETSVPYTFEDDSGDGIGHGTAYVMRLYEVWEYFEDIKIAANEELVSVALRFCRAQYSYTHSTWAKIDTMLCWFRTWTPPLTTSWTNLVPLQVANQPDIRFEQMLSDRSAQTSFNFYQCGSERFLTNYLTKMNDPAITAVGFMLAMEAELADYPSGGYTWAQYLIAASGSVHESFKPFLRLETVTKHNLNHVLSCSVQLTDGGSAVFNYNPTLNRYEMRYQKISETSSTASIIGNIGDSTTLFGVNTGLQSISITRDDANNLYVVGCTGSTVYGNIKYFLCAAFKYLGNYVWTATGTAVGSLGAASDQDGRVNNVACQWLANPTGAVGGTLVILTSRRAGKWGWRQQTVSTVNAGFLLGLAGSVLNEKTSTFDPTPQPNAVWRPFNTSGSGMDMLKIGSPAQSYFAFATYHPCLANSTEPKAAVVRFTVAVDGTPTKPLVIAGSQMVVENDPNGKIRTPWMNSETRYAWFCAGQMEVRNVIDNALFRLLDFTTFNITNFPSFEQIQDDSKWDIIWDSSRAKFWIYYVDSQNPRLIRKVSYDPETNILDASLQLTPSNLGASGSRIVALRAPRGRVDPRCVLIDVAMIDGALQPVDLIIIRDLSMSHVPNAPTVDDILSFDATAAHVFTFNFSDQDPNDYSIAQTVEIKRVSTGLTVFTATHTTAVLVAGVKYQYTMPANTLSNDTAYQFRVRQNDSVDGLGAWSDYVSFSTSGTGGHVTITAPAADNLPMNVSSVIVAWTYINDNPAIIQTGYQVKRINNDTNVTLYDSGIVASTATTVTLTGLTSDLHQRIEVAVRGTGGLLSGTDVRMVYPQFSTPSQPTIIAQAQPGSVDIRITNPPPLGENPLTVSNQIARKLATEADAAFVIIGTAGVNQTYTDRSVASGVDYVYRARGVSITPTYGPWSETAEIRAFLRGMWFSIPGDPTFEEVQFPYGGVGRSETASISQTTMSYVGREYPVTEFGTSKAQAVAITTQIPGPGDDNDTDLMVAAARYLAQEGIVVLYRDGRGRKMYATISNASIVDVEMGSYNVQFTLSRVDYNEALA